MALEKIYNFIWHEFADIYIEQSKKRRGEAQPCLEYVLQASLSLLLPFMPETSAILEEWPVPQS
jgi:valyl-tRNA synthetase